MSARPVMMTPAMLYDSEYFIVEGFFIKGGVRRDMTGFVLDPKLDRDMPDRWKYVLLCDEMGGTVLYETFDDVIDTFTFYDMLKSHIRFAKRRLEMND